MAWRTCDECFGENGPTWSLEPAGISLGWSGGLAALRRVPVVLHESNAVPGLANRWLARWAVEVHVGFEAAARYLPPEKVRFSGNPLRPEVLHAAERRGQKPRNDPLRIAIIGGSLGAATLNRAVLQALPELARLPIVLVHQTGERAYPWVMETIRSRWGEVPCNIQVVPFVEQMGELYAQTDLLIARAGAMTLSEAVWCRVPMVLVPYPHAGTDEQRQNARAVAQAGAALLIEDAQFDGSRLVEVVQEFLRRPERLEEMAARCEALARPDATDQIVEAIVAYLPR
ncbi:MAG: hypothetical protein KatS3mg115_0551 [Candidatus Poribacteria bacterium]|nr:MAG: hypothetical protein KatS3mg115_0551 [Candidatus Poribacteria bacterium]